MDSTVKISLSLHSNKGAYAILLGSGVSAAAGIPTGWQIVSDLITKIARLESDDVGDDPVAWYKLKYGHDPDYSGLLNAVASSPTERNLLLRAYFEPTEEEYKKGMKVPTAAHHALARLTASGYVHLFITTNFDRLLEKALHDINIVPQVLSTPDSIRGAVPSRQSKCTIVKINGDYMDTRIKNTPEELKHYEPTVNSLLDRIIDEYGFIVSGWSAEWDIALRQAFERCKSHRYSTFWASRNPPRADAARQIELRQGEFVQIKDPDTFFIDIARRVTMLEKQTKAEKETKPKRKIKLLLAFLGVILMLGLFSLFYSQYESDVSEEKISISIAVLPFEDMSPNRDQEYFSDGLAEEIINVLMQIPNLKVVGRASSFSFRGKDTNIKTIGKTLNVSHIIQGSVRKFGSQVRIQVYLIDASTGYNLKTYPFAETQLENIFEIQDNIARSITDDLKLSLFSIEGKEIATVHTYNPLALEEFFKGRKLWYERRNFIQQVAHFENAIKLDPNYDRAYAALAETYVVIPTYIDVLSMDSVKILANDAIENSLRLNNNNASAYTAKARYEYKFNLNPEASVEAFDKAITLNPNYGPANFWYGIYFHDHYQLDIAMEKYHKTLELEPRWSIVYMMMANVLLSNNDIDRAQQYLETSKEIQNLYIIEDSFYRLAIKKLDFIKAQLHKNNYYDGFCKKSICIQEDLNIMNEIFDVLAKSNLVDKSYLAEKVKNIQNIKLKVEMSAILYDREILYQSLSKLLNESPYHLQDMLRNPILAEFRSEEKFI